jgi:hypothetical protein
MSTSVNGTAGITFNDGSVLGSQLGIFNRIINGGFVINQRVYTSGTSLSSGVYAHDRWKAGSGGGTYTFTQGALGVNTTITITAGSIVQVIEGCNLAEGGTYVLSWTGTAQGRLNGGTYGSSGTVTVTGWTAGTNLNVEFNTGTLGNVQLVAGSAVSSYAYRPYGTEEALCQRYLPAFFGNTNSTIGQAASGTAALISLPFVVTPRVAPTGITTSAVSSNNFIVTNNATAALNVTGIILTQASTSNMLITASTASGLSAGNATIFVINTASGYIFGTGCEL